MFTLEMYIYCNLIFLVEQYIHLNNFNVRYFAVLAAINIVMIARFVYQPRVFLIILFIIISRHNCNFQYIIVIFNFTILQ